MPELSHSLFRVALLPQRDAVVVTRFGVLGTLRKAFSKLTDSLRRLPPLQICSPQRTLDSSITRAQLIGRAQLRQCILDIDLGQQDYAEIIMGRCVFRIELQHPAI